ncbi:MAG: hypothetical protein AUK48_01345 [Oscillatoriales cyanobacterium CG2_30_44_21]|nr:MAG: hypothetical protein AUK48_01345 [Oscillatoriales cyanobacterium CG2_30_44_21]
MYTLDINFLSDRIAEQAQAEARPPIADSQFLIYGGAVAVAALAIIGGAWFILNGANEGIQTEISKLTAEETNLKGKIATLTAQEAELKGIEDRTNGLVSLFVGNLPASALSDEIRNRTPITVQVESITQATAAAPATGSTITLNGKATSYNELNDFLLLLKSSPLLDGTRTKLVTSTLQQATNDANFTLVNFQVETATTTKSPAEILPELQKKGADGLVARINLLKQQGVIK